MRRGFTIGALLLLLALGAELDAPSAAQQEAPPADSPRSRDVVVRSDVDILWLSGGYFRRGSHLQELQLARGLCINAHPGAGERCQMELWAQLEGPARRIYISPHGIDRTEVTHRAYARCVAAGRCNPSRVSRADARVGAAAAPVAGVTFADATAFCQFVEGRLPTESEWERAARGPDGRPFPWGRQWNDRLANHGAASSQPDPIDGHAYAAPVGSYPAGASPYGALDMAGNVWEWTADRFDEAGEDWSDGLAVDPQGPSTGGERIVRGGSWRSTAETLRATMRIPIPEGTHAPDLGFRCAYDAR